MSEQLTKQDVDFLQEASKDAPLEDVVAARELAAEAAGMDANHEVTVHHEDGTETKIPVHVIGNVPVGSQVEIPPQNSYSDTWRSTAEK